MNILNTAIKKAKASADLSGPFRPEHEAMYEEITRLRRELKIKKQRSAYASKGGRPPSLGEARENQLRKALSGSPVEAGFTWYTEWNSNVLIQYVKKEFRVEWTPRTAQRFLRRVRN